MPPVSALVIALVNPKGGTGKTTLAIHLATAAQREGYGVTLLDTDPQGSCVDWRRRAVEAASDPVAVIHSTDPQALPDVASEASASADVIVIDGAARLQGMTGAVLSVADLALIPVQPSGLDLWGTMEARDLVIDERDRRGLKAAYVASRRDVRTSLSTEVLGVLRNEEAGGFDVLSGTTQRVSYARSVSEGRTVFDTSDASAQAEVRELLQDAARLLEK